MAVYKYNYWWPYSDLVGTSKFGSGLGLKSLEYNVVHDKRSMEFKF